MFFLLFNIYSRYTIFFVCVETSEKIICGVFFKATKEFYFQSV